MYKSWFFSQLKQHILTESEHVRRPNKSPEGVADSQSNAGSKLVDECALYRIYKL